MSARITEGSIGQLTGTFTDAGGVAIAPASISSIRLTLTNIDTENLSVSPSEGVINGREADEVFAGSPTEITVDDAGAYVLTLQPADNVIVVARRQVERHRVALEVTFSGMTKWFTDIVEVLALSEVS